MNKYLSRKCPCCNSSEIQKDIVKAPKDANNFELEQLKKYWNGFFKEKAIFSYVRCLGCGLLYCPIFFTNKQLEILYEQMPANMDEVPLNALFKTQYGYFKYLKKYSRLHGNFLEIGPDIGLFTKSCVLEGNFSKFWLFEPNHSVENALKKVVKNKNFIIINEMFNFRDVPDNTIDVAIMIHVMDHLLDPLASLKQIRKKLKKDSHLLIVTHDESSLLRKLFNWRWPAFCLQHPQLFNKKSTREILNEADFNVVGQGKTTNYFKFSFLLRHLLWAFGFKINKTPDFYGLTIGLKLGNIISIATPK